MIVGSFAVIYKKVRDRVRSPVVHERVAGDIIASIGNGYIDEQGVVTLQRPAGSVPHIDASLSMPSAGDVINDRAVLMAVRTIKQFDQAYLAVERVTIYNENYIEIVVSDRVNVVSTYATDPFYLVSTVESVRKAYEIEGRSIDVIDVRFNKPFVIERYGP